MTRCVLCLMALLWLVSLALAAELTPGQPDRVVYEADFTKGDAHGWAPAHNLEAFTFADGCLATRATGHDAHMMATGLSLPAADISHVRFRIQSDKPGSTQVYFATTDSPDPAKHAVPAAHCPGDGEWHECEVQLGGLAGFTGTLTMLRLDPVNGGGEQARIGIEWVQLIQKAPILVCTNFSANKAVLEPGEEADLTLKLANFGGAFAKPLAAELMLPKEFVQIDPAAEVQWSGPDHTGQATWHIKAQAVGVPRLHATVKHDDKLIVDAKMCLPIVDWSKLDIPEGQFRTEWVRRAGAADGLALFYLPRTPSKELGRTYGAALVRVKDGGKWKTVGVLCPLAHLTYSRDGVEYSEDIEFGFSDLYVLTSKQAGADWQQVAGSARTGQVMGTSLGVRDLRFPVRRISGPVLRVGIGPDGGKKTAALFPGLEFLGEDEPSSNVEMVGDAGYRPSPPPYQVTVPALAVLKDDILCGMMWPPAGQRDQMPVAEFASPNFIDDQPNHRLACFLPGEPHRTANQPVAAKPYVPESDRELLFRTVLSAIPGGKITDVVPLWYERFGLPEAPPLPHSPERALDICIQGWAQTLWFPEQRGFNNHWHVGQTPYWDARLATNVLVHSWQTGEKRWVEALDLKPETTILDVAGSLFAELDQPDPPGSLKTQQKSGLWLYEPPAGMAEKVRKWTDGKLDSLGEVGAPSLGISANNTLPLLSHALRWGDRDCERAALRALRAMEKFRVPRGCQGWEVHIDIPDIYAAARLIDCYRLGHELTGDEHWLDVARYWAYTGLPFLYSYEVPDTGPHASAHIPWPEDIVGEPELVFQEPDAHHPTPWGSIPVFGTSFYRVSWFGNLVQWCGLCWAKSVYPLLEHAPDDVIRAAADGVVYSGIHQTFDQEPYVGLLPDTWHLSSNVIHPAFIGPVRLEDPLRMMLDEPEFGATHLKIVRRRSRRAVGGPDAELARLVSRAQIVRTHYSGHELRWTQRFPPGQVCETLAVLKDTPIDVLVGDRELPAVEDILQAEEGWQRLPKSRNTALRIRHGRERETVSIRF